MRGAMLGAMVALALAQPALGQRLVASTSDPEVSIDSTFAGEKITLFGAIEPEIGQTEAPSGTYDIVIAIEGPSADRLARLKEQTFGIWLNLDQVVFRNFPSFYWIVASAPLDQITDSGTIVEERLSFQAQSILAMGAEDPTIAMFGGELVRLMQTRGLFGVDERAVMFMSDRFYTARVDLPAFVPNGSYTARTLLFRNGEIVARRADSFSVRTAGIERFVADAARNQSLAYGLVCVGLALSTGWLGGLVFRR